MSYLTPLENPNKWLVAVMLDLLEQDTKSSKEALEYCIRTLVTNVDPGLIEQAFGDLIFDYEDLLGEQENNQNSSDQGCLPLGLEDVEE
jgi:hypothetical protein